MRWGADARVLAPPKLREEIQSEAIEMMACYANGMQPAKKTLTA
jgi:predicted DNA-binding transcriptional regulator YafY